MNSTISIILCFTLPCLMTTLGSFLIFFFKKNSNVISVLTLGFASGIMMSASIWSLLLPAIEYSETSWNQLKLVPVCTAFAVGILFMVVLDLICSHFYGKNAEKGKVFKFFSAITIHNIPEGLSVGFAIGSAIATENPTTSAFMFALAISLQNFPEGLATSLPIYSSTKSKPKSFILGTLSGIVEPIFTLVGFYLASSLTFLLPWLLAFSAGAMIYVVLQELIPQIYYKEKAWGTLAFVIGFLFMMILDLAF